MPMPDANRVKILVERVAGPNGTKQWKVARVTLQQLPAMWDAFGDGVLAERLPRPFFDLRFLDIQLWQWIALVVLLLTGLLVTNLIGRRLVVWGEELLNRIPVVRTVYGGVKSFAESVLSQSNSFRKVVMIEYPRAGAWSIGFLTAEDVPEVSERLREPHVAVYISSALNATAGYLVIVPRRSVVELDMSVDAAMKMIITCGVVVPPAANRTSLAKPAA